MDRLRKYEDLLRQNNIKFDALPKEPPQHASLDNVGGDVDSENELSKNSPMNWSSPATAAGKSDHVFETK